MRAFTNANPCISIRRFEGYYDLHGEWVDQHTMVTDGFTDFHIRGDQAGADLYIFLHGTMLDLPDGVTDHAGAVAWCERQFVRTPVTL